MGRKWFWLPVLAAAVAALAAVGAPRGSASPPAANGTAAPALWLPVTRGGGGATTPTATATGGPAATPATATPMPGSVRPAFLGAVSPADGAAGVPVASAIRLTFNAAMDRPSVEGGLRIAPPPYGGAFTWQGDTLTFQPAFALNPNTTYAVTLGAGVRTAGGEALQAPFVWSFTTGPAFARAGAPIAFMRATDQTGTTINLWLMNPDGTGQTPITRMPPLEVAGFPAWLRGRGQLAFASTLGQIFSLLDENLFVANADGSGATMVTGASFPGQRPGPTGAVQVTVNPPQDLPPCNPPATPLDSTFQLSAQGTDHTSPAGSRGTFTLTGVPAGNPWVRVVGAYTGVGEVQARADPPSVPVAGGLSTRLSVTLKAERLLARSPRGNPSGGRLVYILERIYPDCSGGPSDPPFGYWVSRSITHIDAVNADGSGETPLLAEAFRLLGQLDYPDWSPDGARIAFGFVGTNVSGDFSPSGIYVMNADGSGATQLTFPNGGLFPTTYAFDGFPAWSPDGRKIAFARFVTPDVLSGVADIYVVHADGTGLQKVTSAPYGAFAEKPAWSPDGARIAYQVRRGGTALPGGVGPTDIYVMDADGTHPMRLTDDGLSGYPAW